MKKVLCAVALAAIAAPLTSAQAITLYEKDGFKYTLKNDWQIQLRQDQGSDQDLDVEYDDLELKNRAEYDLNNGLTAFGELDFGFKKAADESNDDERAHLEEAYLGMGTDTFSALFGKTDGATDGFGVTEALESGPFGDDAFDAWGSTGGDDLILLQGNVAGLTILVDYNIEADSEDSCDDGEFYGVRAEYSVAGFTVGGAYQTVDPYDPIDEETGLTEDTDDFDVYGVYVTYDAKVVKVGADYSVASKENNDYSFMNISVTAPVGDDVTVAAGYQMID